MQRLSSMQLPMFSRAPAPPRWWLPALARRSDRIMVARCRLAPHVPRIRHGSRYTASSRGRSSKELGALDRRSLIPSVIHPICASNDTRISLAKRFPITEGINNEENRVAIQEFFGRYSDARPANGKDDGRRTMGVIYDDKDVTRTTVELSDCKKDTRDVTYGQEDARGVTEDVIALCSDDSLGNNEEDAREQSASDVSDGEEYSDWPDEDPICYHNDDVPHVCPIPLSSHRDGSINRGTYYWRKEFRVADRNETRLEAMMLSDPSEHCVLDGENCLIHRPCSMWQVFSLKLSKIHMDCGSVELYGYIAARDQLDPLLNYIVNISRDDPVTVEQGSLIEMTGPKRGIDLSCALLIEYDMRIKTGDEEKDDLQLIDGAAIISEMMISSKPYTTRIHGSYGAVDMKRMCLQRAVEATIEVFVSKVQCNFDLGINCFTSGLDEEIRLFDGAIGKSCGLRRRVVAVKWGTSMDLKFKMGSGSLCSAELLRSFKAVSHGCSRQFINTELASILVKVTWSTLNESLQSM